MINENDEIKMVNIRNKKKKELKNKERIMKGENEGKIKFLVDTSKEYSIF